MYNYFFTMRVHFSTVLVYFLTIVLIFNSCASFNVSPRVNDENYDSQSGRRESNWPTIWHHHQHRKSSPLSFDRIHSDKSAIVHLKNHQYNKNSTQSTQSHRHHALTKQINNETMKQNFYSPHHHHQQFIGKQLNNNNNRSARKVSGIATAQYFGNKAVVDPTGFHHKDREIEKLEDNESKVEFTSTVIPYTKHHQGRRVCTRAIPSSNYHYSAREFRYYAKVMMPVKSDFICCPGRSQISPISYGCNRPTCTVQCHNGGVCGTHGKCNCPKGFTGSQCQIDIDECITEKPCGQICRNLPGSYECHCRYGFQLQPDGQSCKNVDDKDGTAFEATDLELSVTPKLYSTSSHDVENEVDNRQTNKDYAVILQRLLKLEKLFARDKKETEATEMNMRVNQAVDEVSKLRLAAKNILHYFREAFGSVRHEIYDMKNKFELERKKIDHLTQRFNDFQWRPMLQHNREVIN